jgi:hypothetical protein
MLVLSLVLGCNSVECSSPDAVLVQEGALALTCGEADVAVEYIELLAGRSVASGETQRAYKAIASKFREDPGKTRSWLEQVRTTGASLGGSTGLAGAEARAERVWAADHGEDLITPADGDLWNVQSRALSVWAKDDGERVAMTESDLEAWIRYASLCREAQGAGVLRISVADRVTVYRDLIARFDEGDRMTQVALSSLGTAWPQVRDRWQSASYSVQQEWISQAPLPPPMTATSLGYAEAVFSSNLAQHAAVLQEVLGPFPVGEASEFTETQ